MSCQEILDMKVIFTKVLFVNKLLKIRQDKQFRFARISVYSGQIMPVLLY